MIRKPNDTIALLLEIVSTILVSQLLFSRLMIFAIHLNDETILQRHKVCDIHSYNMLTTKMDSRFVAFQLLPESVFSWCHRSAVLHSIVFNATVCNSLSSLPLIPFSLFYLHHHYKHPSLREGLGGPYPYIFS